MKHHKLGPIFVKVLATILALGAVWWMVYAVLAHYHSRSASWDYMPFVVSGLLLMFCFAILSKSATQGAANVILPFVEQLRLGRRSTDVVAVPTAVPAPGSEQAPPLSEDKP